MCSHRWQRLNEMVTLLGLRRGHIHENVLTGVPMLMARMPWTF